jgi:demethylmenaquinone methyltransferase/2-methoxy-6-polyprenyl-1,4-benzoquinol methylase
MNLQSEDKVLDLGAGSGRNALLMRKHLSEEGEIIGLDIAPEMITQFKKKSAKFNNVKILEKRIDEPLDFQQEFDKVFISFVLHGFPHAVRKQIIQNAFQALKPGGTFYILDYNEFDLKKMPFPFRIPFKFIECPYAFDFIEKDWKNILSEIGFGDFSEFLFLHKYVRLLGTKKSL